MQNKNHNEPVLMDISEAKANLVKIHQACDTAILQKVSIQGECVALEAHRKDEENKLALVMADIESAKTILSQTQAQLNTDRKALGDVQAETRAFAKQLVEEKTAMVQEAKELAIKRLEFEHIKADAISMSNQAVVDSQNANAKKLKIQEILNQI